MKTETGHALLVEIAVNPAHLHVSRVQTGFTKASDGHAFETVSLWPERAVYWPRKRTLLTADLHWGKSQTFRSHGIPIPGGILQADLDRLSRVQQESGAERIIFLGDLIHAKAGLTDDLFDRIAQWRKTLDVELILIRGNHDRHCKNFPSEWEIEVLDGFMTDGPFAFSHHPDPVEGHYTWAGHIHPVISLASLGDRLRMPCFHLRARVGVLPAFSLFTGGFNIQKGPGERVIALAESELIEI